MTGQSFPRVTVLEDCADITGREPRLAVDLDYADGVGEAIGVTNGLAYLRW